MINGLLSSGQQQVFNSVMGDQGGLFQPAEDPQAKQAKKTEVANTLLPTSLAPRAQDLLKATGVSAVGFLLLNDTLQKIQKTAADEREGMGSLFEGLPGASLLPVLGTKLLGFASVALIAGGLLKGAMDGIASAAKSEEWGVSKAAGFTSGFLTGNNESWTSNALKWAAIGGGIGFLGGGPLGMIAGGLLGGAFGAIMHNMDTEKLANDLDNLIPNILTWVADNTGLASLLGGAIAGGALFKSPIGMFVGAVVGLGMNRVISGLAEGQISLDFKEILRYLLADTGLMALFGAGTGAAIGFKVGMVAGGPLGAIAGALIGGAIGAIAMAIIADKSDPGKSNVREFNADLQEQQNTLSEQLSTQQSMQAEVREAEMRVVAAGSDRAREAHQREVDRLKAAMARTLDAMGAEGATTPAELIARANRSYGANVFSLTRSGRVAREEDIIAELRGVLEDQTFAEQMQTQEAGNIPAAAQSLLARRFEANVEDFGKTVLDVQDGIFTLQSRLPRGGLFGPKGEGVEFDPGDDLYVMASTNPSRDKLSGAVDRLNERIDQLASSIETYRPQTNNNMIGMERTQSPSLQQLLQVSRGQ